MYQTLRYEKQENIGILTINRPEALNALNSTVIGDLEQAITEVEKDAELALSSSPARAVPLWPVPTSASSSPWMWPAAASGASGAAP